MNAIELCVHVVLFIYTENETVACATFQMKLPTSRSSLVILLFVLWYFGNELRYDGDSVEGLIQLCRMKKNTI